MKKFINIATAIALALGVGYGINTVTKAQEIEAKKTEYALCIGLEKHYQAIGREYIKGTCHK